MRVSQPTIEKSNSWIERKIIENVSIAAVIIGLGWIAFGTVKTAGCVINVSSEGVSGFADSFLPAKAFHRTSEIYVQVDAFFVTFVLSGGVGLILSGAVACFRSRPGIIGGIFCAIVIIFQMFLNAATFHSLNRPFIWILAVLLVASIFPIMVIVSGVALLRACRNERENHQFDAILPTGLETESELEVVIQLLWHEEKPARLRALHSLGEKGDGARLAVPDIVELLENEIPDSADKKSCELCGRKLTMSNRCIGSRQCRGCINRLESEANSCYRPSVAEMAAETLGKIGRSAQQAIPTLHRGTQSNNHLLSKRCAEALKAIIEPPKPAPKMGKLVQEPFLFQCSRCSKSYKSHKSMAGKRMKCRNCGVVFQIQTHADLVSG